MKQSKARLLTGILCVGVLVFSAAAIIATDVQSILFPTEPQPFVVEFVAILCLFLAFAALQLPFDISGGLLIPAMYSPPGPDVAAWFRRWGRSVAVQVVFYVSTLSIYLLIGRAAGPVWLVAMFVALQVVLVAAQELLWRLMTAGKLAEPGTRAVSFVYAQDPRFVGGITGLPGLETILLPARWRTSLKQTTLQSILERRRLALSSGARFRGILAAILWNTFAFTAAILFAGGTVTSVAELVTVLLWFLLLSFAGLLILPAWSRHSVFGLDQRIATDIGVNALCEAVNDVDRLTEQDTARSAAAESIFQPIPCPQRRRDALNRVGEQRLEAWNVARMALFLSWGFGGPLARAVHCNVGRPELWVLLPTD